MTRSRHLRPSLLAIRSLLLTAAFAAGCSPVAAGPPGLRLETVAKNLGGIGGISHAGDERLFLALLDGRIVIVSGGRALPTPFLDLSSRISTGGERGLLSIAFHPRYRQNGLFFVDYTNRNGNTEIARFAVSGSDPNRANAGSGVVLLTIQQPYANHNGGQLQFGPDGYLYVGMGDGGSGGDPQCNGQRSDSLLGKLLRLDVDHHADSPPFYAIPPDNPYVSPGDPPDEVWARGVRNPWRFTFDRATGDLYIGDVGQGDREEIDLQPATSRGGENYGWNVEEGSRCYSTSPCASGAPPCGDPRLVRPILEYDHSQGECSVTGGYVYRGHRIPVLGGNYLYGDFCTGRIWRGVRTGGSWHAEQLSITLPSLTTFGEDASGELYLGTLTGRLERLVGPSPSARVGTFSPEGAAFAMTFAADGASTDAAFVFGEPGGHDLPVAGDWDGDGADTIGVFDPATFSFRLRNALAAGEPDLAVALASPGAGWRPVAGDWDGDGTSGVGVYRSASATFRLRNALDGGGPVVRFRFGLVDRGGLAVAGDWNGDGRDGVGVYYPATGVFRLRNVATAGNANFIFAFRPVSSAGLLPVSGDWDGDGRDSVGLYDPATATFYLRNALSSGPTDQTFQFGSPGSLPVAGSWPAP